MATDEGIRLFENNATPEQVRLFVTTLKELEEKVREARAARKEAIDSNDEIEDIDAQMKELRERRKQIIATNAVIAAYEDEYKEAVEVKKQLIADARADGVPQREIDFAIKMLKKDIDPAVTQDIYTNIADLVE